MREKIIKELKKIEEQEQVKIILAVESGSRAWGFASKDSDYDVRFIYVRKMEDYLKLEKVRDVIEWHLDDELDINGWDIKKMLQLLHNSNPTVFEWFSSPIVYLKRDEANIIQEIMPEYFSVKNGLYHYCNTAESNYREYLKTDDVRIKKYFYVLRPLLAAKWILDKKTAPPILFDDLVKAVADKELVPEIEKLLILKKNSSELGIGPKIKVFNDYFDNELPRLKEIAREYKEKETDIEKLNKIFLEIII